MKSFRKIIQHKTILFSMAIVFCFSLQSFKNVTGIQIEKRHYRKGYYIHIIHGVKTQAVHQAVVDSNVKQEKPQAIQQQRSIDQSPPQNQIDNMPQRNMPPSSARVPSN